MDETRLQEVMGQLVGHMTGGAQPAIDVARQRAAEAGVAERPTFEIATAKDYPGKFDLICFFD